MIILIDSGILGQLCRPNLNPETLDLKRWFDRVLIRTNVVSSKICDYEVRRGLLLAQKQGLVADGLSILDDLDRLIDFLYLEDRILDLAADIWARARASGQPTAGDLKLDADMIICATWQDLASRYPGQEVVIVTTNVRHLSRFANAVVWQDLSV
ncbi:nucleic acid-binding protein [Chamaesiphon polymorphus]|uniref:Nucleic acid-binding protein n=1 Tax=Chamaesiphon polymorphus CCALA 037 TaxID=2107692 RepID=A0A2T1FXR9_9CYAN|nr:nucleic acid-binding protein [Chamaesiphon polymorphus]PSB49797.1 nucleic acid-binding protein [Chamaesiphon polymorphus CCALA 037]